MTPELTLLSNLVSSQFVYALALIIGIGALYRAVVKGEAMAWVIVAICSVVAAFPQIFNSVRGTGYAIIQPLAPSGDATQLVPFTASNNNPKNDENEGEPNGEGGGI